MTTPEEIVMQSKTCKSDLQNHFVGRRDHLGKSLAQFNKHELNALYFLSMEKPVELVHFLKTSFFQLEDILNNPKYTTYSINKKRGGTRQIDAPGKQLKAIQKHLNYHLQAYYLCIKPIEVHGFVVNPHYLGTYCNIAENAKVHVKKRNVLNIDLKDFFPSIAAWQVKEMFSSPYFGFSEQLAMALTMLTTYEGKLPIGAPTSPVISNFICLQLDADLINYCKQNEIAYSRYADDLTFSSDRAISNDQVREIGELIKRNHFEINEKKIRLKPAHRKQTVTGLTVNNQVNVDRRLLKKIRAMLHDFRTNGFDASVQRHFKVTQMQQKHRTKFIHRLEGYIQFVGQVRGKTDSLYMKYKSELNQAIDTMNAKPSEQHP
jgi:RNA-directed DNA polymerase